MTLKEQLIADIEAYCRVRRISESTFGLRAVNDGKFVRRLRAGAAVTDRIIDRVHTFIAAATSVVAKRDPRAGA